MRRAFPTRGANNIVYESRISAEHIEGLAWPAKIHENAIAKSQSRPPRPVLMDREQAKCLSRRGGYRLI